MGHRIVLIAAAVIEIPGIAGMEALIVTLHTGAHHDQYG